MIPEVLALERHLELDLALRQHAQRIELSFLEFCDLAREVIDGGHYARFGFESPDRYFTDRIGVSYRSLRRCLSVLEALDRLPEPERPEARAALAEIGTHKAGSIARALGRDGVDWRALVDFARDATVEAVQDRVSRDTGAQPRGAASEPGERFLAFVLNAVPPDERDFVERVFEGLMVLASDTRNPLAAFLVMAKIGQRELAAIGRWPE